MSNIAVLQTQTESVLCVTLCQAYQLIRAVSVLLNFTREEEDMLKQTLEYKVRVLLTHCIQSPSFTIYLFVRCRYCHYIVAANKIGSKTILQLLVIQTVLISDNYLSVFCAVDVLVWIQALSKGYRPAFHLRRFHQLELMSSRKT